MYHVILILMVVALTVLSWNLVQSSPPVLSMVLPRTLCLAIGTVLLVLGVFSAFAWAVVKHSPDAMLHSFVQGYAGLWFILATSSGERGSYEDDRMLRRMFLMMGLLVGAIIAMLYLKDPRLVATLSLLLIAGGFWVTANYMRLLDGSNK